MTLSPWITLMKRHKARAEHNGLSSGWRKAIHAFKEIKEPKRADKVDSNLFSLGQIDQTVIDFTSKSAIPLLRVSLGVVYIWFGLLKITGASPVADLVKKTAFLIPKEMFVRLVGLLEIAVGLGLLFRAALRLTLLLFFFQLTGTFMVVLADPGAIFQKGNPFLLTKDGEFVLKNLILLSAGLVVGSTAHRQDEEIGDSGRSSSH